MNLTVRLPIYDRATQKRMGLAADISVGGMLIVGEKPLPVEHQLAISLDVPSNPSGWERAIVDLQTIWCAQDKSNRIYWIGCKFLTIHSDILFKLQKLVDPQQPFS